MIKQLRPYLFLAAFLFVILTIPEGFTREVRSFFQSRLAPSFLSSKKQDSYGLTASVIFRQPSSWGSTFWINVGKRDAIEENSPVVVGDAVVGVVEEVKEKKSRVRLITDQALCLSVRAVRGGVQNRLLYQELIFVQELLQERPDLENAKELAALLASFQEQLDVEETDLYLAKGEVHGSSAPLWRMLGQTLKGEGFNYDFSDEKGAARDLRTGADQSGYAAPLIKVGDLLLTTGMDGIFPPDLKVGIVTSIYPLHEGGCSYSLEAKPLAPNLNTLSEVIVLPAR